MTSAGEVISALAKLPLGDLDQIAPHGAVLITAPHPDDESLGCGGFIAESCSRGRPPVVVIMTDGTASHPNSLIYPMARLRALRERETCAALTVLGLSSDRLHFMRLRDSAMPLNGALAEAAIAELRKLAQFYQCETILAPWIHDPHCDHETNQMMVRAAMTGMAVSLYSYPVWGWLLPSEQLLQDEVVEGWRLDIATHLDRKRRAIASHQSQYSDLINDDPHGFRLPPDLLSSFERPYEAFIRTVL
jgi:LmbE family N-acetylglucosaminyl deacetylase